MSASFPRQVAIPILLWSSLAMGQVAAEAPASGGTLQQEADHRVVAARCGTPAFEKAFTRQSRAMVAAGLVGSTKDPVAAEKMITTLRRNPYRLIATPADCRAELAALAALQKQRARLVKTPRGR